MLCLLGWIALTVLMQYAKATRFEARGGVWLAEFADFGSWLWTAVCAAFYGLWGYFAILVGGRRKSSLGQNIFPAVGIIYLIWMAAVAWQDYGSAGFLTQFFENFIVVLASAIVMAPVMLVCAVITKASETVPHD
ncbi:hypothetical protein [Qipengyuania psychrotolerans]|uniref:Uncharacterized protein n=1 Tax=Qipengyuania psychrotolerans TaxID=2867238 RepID=A0ABX8ZIH2_9SPHN|nr:hypothetical protein [Qipengyuania psychrotolerans]QZD87307.1 hypothetical protein K3166_00925 [Qipengyuania psychrotolerans]